MSADVAMNVAADRVRPLHGITRSLRGYGVCLPAATAPLLAIVLLALAQELVSRTGAINPSQFPPISIVLRTLIDEIATGALWVPLTRTLTAWAISLTLAFTVALILGVAIGLNVCARELVGPILECLRPIPSTSIIPLIILAIGVNVRGAVFFAFFGTVWQILPMVVRATANVEPVSRDTARAFNFTRWQTFRWLTLPSMELYLLTSLRIGASISLILIVSMELLTGVIGIGREISFAYSGSNLPRMYAYILVSGLLGALVNLLLVTVIERRTAALKGQARS